MTAGHLIGTRLLVIPAEAGTHSLELRHRPAFGALRREQYRRRYSVDRLRAERRLASSVPLVAFVLRLLGAGVLLDVAAERARLVVAVAELAVPVAALVALVARMRFDEFTLAHDALLQLG